MSTILLILLLSPWIATGNYTRTSRSGPKLTRFFTFHSQDKDLVNVSLEFSVPFLSIPVGKALQQGQHALANLNLGAVALTGTILFATVVILPGLLKIFSKKSYPYQRSDIADGQFWRGLEGLEKLLLDNKIDGGECLRRMICWTVKKSSGKVKEGTASPKDKILDGIASSPWFQDLLEDEALLGAFRKGLERSNCAKEFNCRITPRNVQVLLKQLTQTY